MGSSPFFFGANKNMLNKRADKLELLRIAEAVALEKSIDKELIINSMETGIAKAAKSKFGQDNEIKVLINRENGDIEIFRKLVIVEKPENSNTEIRLDDAITLNEVKAAINELPDKYRYVMMLFLMEGYDHQEISQILSITEVSSRTQLSRGKSKLRELLKF